MKYIRLTKEQLEELNQEFAKFLAAQNIDRNEWEAIKKDKPQVAEQELDVFSDLIWEGTLNKAKYLEQFSPQYVFLFAFEQKNAQSIIVKSLNSEIDLTTQQGLKWLQENIFSDQVNLLKGYKEFENRNEQMFDLIKKGAQICNGEWFENVSKHIK
ncbi:MAG: DUF6495 family protein [Bacteroidota bacterium]|nr:DUF6495 family protein [Bacteroidota bacterium]